MLHHAARAGAWPIKEVLMIEVGGIAPTFSLTDQLGRQVNSADLIGKSHLMLLFYPLDFTPT
jgi:peroxiredoxin